MILEVIVLSLDDARAARDGGADRVEVVRSIERDGLTPPLDLVRAIFVEIGLPLRAMVRESEGFHLTGPRELAQLRRTMGDFGEIGIDGAVLGYTRNGVLDLDAMDAVMSAAPALPVTLHRAFDGVRDPFAAIELVRTRPQIDRILTAGDPRSPTARARRLARYAGVAGARPIIMAGGGLDHAAVNELARDGRVREVHVGRAARVGNTPTGPVSVDLVRRLKNLCDGGKNWDSHQFQC